MKWFHSYEEDTATETVYRPKGFNFPRSRGRSGFDFRFNNIFFEINIAPQDGHETREGIWGVSDDLDLILEIAGKKRNLQIVALNERVLRVLK